jgi:UDP-N-acetylmuramate--alanine ligase
MRIYFSGIGGVGIGPLARIARDAGYDVLGSDSTESLITKELESSGISISYDQSGAYLKEAHLNAPIDWFVHTAALSNDHPELVIARELGIKTSKRDELLAHIIDEKDLKLIAVTGTHGKTTTTGMLVWTLKQLGIPVSYSIGTTLSWGPSGHYDPASEYFVYECDEFDRNFLHFSPHLSLITSIEYDHPDTYPTEGEYQSAFRQFIHESDMVVLWQKDADYIKSRYPNAWSMQNDEVLKITLAGEHNRRNGTLVLKALERLTIGENLDNRRWLEQFPGTDRRFEKLGNNLYSDYGHTPTEIKATLQLARELSDHVILIYQPHQNIRQHEIREQYTDEIFEDADEVYWLPTYLSREDPNLAILTPAELTTRLTATSVQQSELDDQLWDSITQQRENGKLVLAMGAGSIDSWIRSKI